MSGHRATRMQPDENRRKNSAASVGKDRKPARNGRVHEPVGS